MRRYLNAIATTAFVIILMIRLNAMLQEPSPARAWLSLTYSRLTRPLIGDLAPPVNCNAPPSLLEKYSYSIILKTGQTMERHKRAVGRGADIDAVTQEVLDYPFPGFQITYFAKIDDRALLNAIRADPGVDFVECDVVGDVQAEGVLVRDGGGNAHAHR